MRKNKEIYLIFFWTILIFITAFIFIIPNIKKIATISEKIRKTESQLEAMRQSSQAKEEAEKNYQLVKTNLPMIKAMVPHQGDELLFITELEETASKNQLEQKINILLEKNKEGTIIKKDILPFQITLDGKFYNFLNYLIDLEKSKFYLNIEKIQISQSQSPVKSFDNELIVQSQEVHVVLNGNSYWQ